MSFFNDIMQDANRVINNILGVSCTYNHQDGEVTNEVDIIIDRNKLVKDEYGVFAGYRSEASINKEQIEEINCGEEFVDESGTTWEITDLFEETDTKWYVGVAEVS